MATIESELSITFHAVPCEQQIRHGTLNGTPIRWGEVEFFYEHNPRSISFRMSLDSDILTTNIGQPFLLHDSIVEQHIVEWLNREVTLGLQWTSGGLRLEWQGTAILTRYNPKRGPCRSFVDGQMVDGGFFKENL